jgi:osmoprotectant transport system ATP-binding protein
VLELIGVSKRFGAAPAVDGADLRIEPGRTTVLIGPSGCGKSTLLRLMIGLLRPDAGRVLFEGQAVHEGDVRALRRRMGYVIQDGGLFPHLTAQGNVTLMAHHLGLPAERIRTRLDALLALTKFPPDALARHPVELSGGQRQRVSLMRALMLDPDVLLLDEPLGALDPMIRSELQGDLRGIFRSLGKTVVLVTHDLAEAGFLGDRLVLLRGGRVVQEGSLEDLVRRPRDPFVTSFVNAQRSPLAELA